MKRALVTTVLMIMGWGMMTPSRAQQQTRPAQDAAQPEDTDKTAPHLPAETTDDEAEAKDDKDAQDTPSRGGITLPDDEKVRIGLRFLAGYGFDGAQATLGLEKQGRLGYVIVELFGKLNEHFSYRVELNPVNETEPLPACGEANFFFPNMPPALGPHVACDSDGRIRVDDYRFIALDPLPQQGPVRQAYVEYTYRALRLRSGRFILPLGLSWEEGGSFSAKDATHIQRINAEASFGVMMSLTKRVRGRRLAELSVAGTLGDGNRFHDYDYFYWLDGSLDTNSWPALLISGAVEPVGGVEFRAAVKRGGHTGSTVERLPNFYASKRNDDAVILSGRYRPVRYAVLFGELVRYTWGPMTTSAGLIGMDPAPLAKDGYYVGGDVSYPLTREVTIGWALTREELSRDDSLVKLMAEQGRYGVRLGKKERSSVYRFYTDISNVIRVAVYRNNVSNPYPWLSGIVPVAGETAFGPGRGSDKWGVIFSFRLE